ncbi:Evi5 [Symbiodinium pilosum]|uniref:Evi5 protein n=1 Tax=Symbiodinium pilosum TaxID=2952 RepID=A0A812TVP8_SYMPI|nr:Evi5 [Symbiodinium pilosum]
MPVCCGRARLSFYVAKEPEIQVRLSAATGRDSCDEPPGGLSQPIVEALWSEDLGEHRGQAWKELLLGGITLQQRAGTPQDDYEKLCNQTSQFDSAIRRDVHRTLPQEELFRERQGKGQQALFRLLRALAIRLWDVGYCQSLNFIVATLIGVFPDDETLVFNCSLALLLRHSLVDLYRPRFPKLGVIIWQFDRIVEGFLPKVHAALTKHGVNSEYYAIQWFLSLFASDLPQRVVRRIWDRFLVAGWRIIVQVGLALLYSIQDELDDMETCVALSFLRKFAQTRNPQSEGLLKTASSFKVSHRLLSALEAAYSWEEDAQLTVIKDLNNGQVHWAVQAVPRAPPTPVPQEGEEPPVPIPRAFTRGSPVGACLSGEEGPEERNEGKVLPFLVRNLDTGETSILKRAFFQYRDEIHRQAQAKAGPVVRRQSESGY